MKISHCQFPCTAPKCFQGNLVLLSLALHSLDLLCTEGFHVLTAVWNQDPSMGVEASCACMGHLLAQHHNESHWYKSGLLAINPAVCRVESQNVTWPLMAAVRANPQCKTEVAFERATMTPSPLLSSTILAEGQQDSGSQVPGSHPHLNRCSLSYQAPAELP